jgi:protein BCP1
MRQSSVPSRKRQKALDKSTAHHIPADGIYSFHPEDECIMQVCRLAHTALPHVSFTDCVPSIQLSMHHLSYSFNSAQPREKDSFGLDILGRFMLMDAANLPDLVCLMAEKYHVDS